MNKVLLIVAPVLILGIVGGLAFSGVIAIPGITPVKMVKNPYAGDPILNDKGEPVVDEETKKPKTQPKLISAEDLKKLQAEVEERKKKQEAARNAAATPPKEKKKGQPSVAVQVKKLDPELGEKKLAQLWNELEAEQLKELAVQWKEPELARILLKMDSSKVAELLALLEPKKAASISRALQKEASQIRSAA